MGENYYFDEQMDSNGRNARLFIIAGLLGGIIGLIGTLVSTYIVFAIWPIGPMPFIEVIALISSISRFISMLAAILLIMGIYGLSVRYKAPILILVAALKGVVLILNEIIEEYFAFIGDISSMVIVGLGTFIVGSLTSIIFGITLLSLRDRSQQPTVFTIYGLVEVMWPAVYFFSVILYVSFAYIISQSISVIVGILLVILYYNELQRGRILSDTDTSDWSQPSEVWQ